VVDSFRYLGDNVLSVGTDGAVKTRYGLVGTSLDICYPF